MDRLALTKLILTKAHRNLQDFYGKSYADGVISAKGGRYESIWNDYNKARENLIELSPETFSELDKVMIPAPKQVESFFGGNLYVGFPVDSRDSINAAIESAFAFIEEYELQNPKSNDSENDSKKSAELIIKVMSNWSNMISSYKAHRSGVNPIVVTNEYEMQYLLEGILRLLFDDVRPETYTLNYANKSNRTDFLLPKQKILIETKMTREGLNDKKLAEELIIDKEHYRKHPDIDIILCLVYDPERRINNPEGIKDIEETLEPPYFSIHFSD